MSPTSEIHDEIMGSFRQGFSPVRVDRFYRLSMCLVALTIVLLPAIYAALIAVAGWALYWHATHGLGTGQNGLFYCIRLFLHAALFIFMMKGLVAPRGKPSPKRALKREEEPLLFLFVEHLCRLVGAPVPQEIRVDCRPNASAGFRHGFWGMLRKDLVLTIGLPLAGGLSTRQFAGTLAHELGHLAQDGGMRTNYSVRAVNHWFARVVYGRDIWDEMLERHEAKAKVPAWWATLASTQLMIWLTRQILWCLMQVGRAVCCFMMKQMEYDADRCGCRVAGSDSFEETMRLIHALSLAHRLADRELLRSYEDHGRLVDDFVGLSLLVREKIPAEWLANIDAKVETEKATLFDTHPTDRERIDNARAEDAPGVFDCPLAATVLFADFAQLSRDVTGDLYGQVLGKAKARAEVVNLSDFMKTA